MSDIVHNLKAYIVAIITIMIWASVYSVLSAVLRYIPAGELAFLRLAIAIVFLLPYVIFTRTPVPSKKYWGYLFIIGAFGFAGYFILLNLGQSQVGVGTSSFIIATTPIIAACLAVFFLEEKLTLLGCIGYTISLIGISLIVIGQGQKLYFQFSTAIWILLSAAFVHAIHFVIKKVCLYKLAPIQVVFYSMLIAAILLAPFSQGALKTLQTLHFNILCLVIFLGIFPSALAHLMWAYVLRNFPVSIATIFLNTISPMAVFTSYLWLGQKPSVYVLIGGALVILAVILVQAKQSQANPLIYQSSIQKTLG